MSALPALHEPSLLAKEKEKPWFPGVCGLQMARRLISCFNQSSPLKEITAITPPLSPETWSLERRFLAAQSDSTLPSVENGFHLLSVEAAGGLDPPLVCLTSWKPAPASRLRRPPVSTQVPTRGRGGETEAEVSLVLFCAQHRPHQGVDRAVNLLEVLGRIHCLGFSSLEAAYVLWLVAPSPSSKPATLELLVPFFYSHSSPTCSPGPPLPLLKTPYDDIEPTQIIQSHLPALTSKLSSILNLNSPCHSVSPMPRLSG